MYLPDLKKYTVLYLLPKYFINKVPDSVDIVRPLVRPDSSIFREENINVLIKYSKIKYKQEFHKIYCGSEDSIL